MWCQSVENTSYTYPPTWCQTVENPSYASPPMWGQTVENTSYSQPPMWGQTVENTCYCYRMMTQPCQTQTFSLLVLFIKHISWGSFLELALKKLPIFSEQHITDRQTPTPILLKTNNEGNIVFYNNNFNLPLRLKIPLAVSRVPAEGDNLALEFPSRQSFPDGIQCGGLE